jgi:hypothetical protein
MTQLGSVILCDVVTQISPLPITARKSIREKKKKKKGSSCGGHAGFLDPVNADR